jgi:hypothetical protein
MNDNFNRLLYNERKIIHRYYTTALCPSTRIEFRPLEIAYEDALNRMGSIFKYSKLALEGQIKKVIMINN